VTAIPADHIHDAHKLEADAEIDLFELTPNDGSGTIRFKNDNPAEWQGNLYEGIPLVFTGFKKSVDGSALSPKLTIGDGSLDLSPFKPYAYDGYLDDGIVKHMVVLLDNLLNDRNVKTVQMYRIKRVPLYHRLSIELQLATASDALGFTVPYRQYYPPAFPAVQQ
jgi:phage-related protein